MQPQGHLAVAPGFEHLCVAVSAEAAAVTAVAFGAKLIGYTLLRMTVGLSPVLSIRSGSMTQLLGGSFCAFCWSAGRTTSFCSWMHVMRRTTNPSSPFVLPGLLFV